MVQENVSVDFRGTGVLALKAMVFFCQNYERKVAPLRDERGISIHPNRVFSLFSTLVFRLTAHRVTGISPYTPANDRPCCRCVVVLSFVRTCYSATGGGEMGVAWVAFLMGLRGGGSTPLPFTAASLMHDTRKAELLVPDRC